MKNRLGKFYITQYVLEHHPETVADLTENMAIVRAEALFERRAFEYLALSPLFDELEPGKLAPEYMISCDLSGEVTAIRFDSTQNTTE